VGIVRRGLRWPYYENRKGHSVYEGEMFLKYFLQNLGKAPWLELPLRYSEKEKGISL
jgi:hypothetical protein